jgi:UDP-3-O-[3-hydroxymyristoyl] glucosamine N-acyltransferase
MAGNESVSITGINEIHVVEEGDIVFVDHPKYYTKALESAASVILINKEVDCPAGKALLVHPDPFTAFNQLTQHFVPYQPIQNHHQEAEIHPSAIVEPGVILGKHVVKRVLNVKVHSPSNLNAKRDVKRRNVVVRRVHRACFCCY